jgi:cytochrome c556
MPLSKITAIASAVVVAGFAAFAYAQSIVVDPAIAGMSVDQLVKARQDAMKEDGSILRGAGKLTGDAAVEAATHVLQNFTNFPALFREGSEGGDALPDIWERWDDFTAILKEGQLAAGKMLEAAKAGDAGLYQDSIRALGQTCGECHQQFRD